MEEYGLAFEILDDIIGLEFIIEDHPDTDDTCEDEFMDLDKAAHEGILSLNRDDLLRDYIESCRHSSKDSKYEKSEIFHIPPVRDGTLRIPQSMLQRKLYLLLKWSCLRIVRHIIALQLLKKILFWQN